MTWLTALPAAVRTRITTVCTDMWEGYVTAVEEVLPPATIVIDRFHVARQYRDTVDTLRKQEVKRLRKELPEPQHAALFHAVPPPWNAPPARFQSPAQNPASHSLIAARLPDRVY